MKANFFWFVVILVLCMGGLYAQDCQQIDCPGQCGRFTDNNGDGFCDFGQLSTKPAVSDTVKPVGAKQKALPQEKVDAIETPVDTAIAEADTLKTAAYEAGTTPKKSSKYDFIPILIVTLLAYLISVALVKKNVMSKPTHRKIWNVLLCITFLVSGLLGLLLAIFINYHYYPVIYMKLLWLHVEFGIAMAIISVFHILWHIPYFKNLLVKR